MPVRWLGVQTVSARFADLVRVLPVRVRASALGDQLPVRDLVLSPGHALLLNGNLVQAGALVNGTTIVRDTHMPERFHDYHVELDTHVVLVAKGMPAESYPDGLEPMPFDNAAERVGEPTARELPYPRMKAGRQVPVALRSRLAARVAAMAGQTARAA